jgi:TetR/AcrR family transcriptional regulator, cholesterol catabolism regulator
MRRASRQVEVNNGNSRSRLTREAAKLFAKVGYERTTMRNIASATGIKLGSITYYFKNKEDILYEVIRKLIESGEERAVAAMKEDLPVLSKLRTLIKIEVESFIDDTGSVTINEWRSLQRQRQLDLLRHRRTYEDIWLAVLGECYEKGLVRARPEIVRRLLHGAFASSVAWYRDQLVIDELVDQVLLLITQRQ